MYTDCIVQTEDNSQSYDDWCEMQSALESVCIPHAPTWQIKIDYKIMYIHKS